MAQESLPTWVQVGLGSLGLVPTALMAGIAFFRYRSERSEKGVETAAELRDRVRATMDTQSLAMYDRLERENKRLLARLDETSDDRDRGWELARWWNRESHRVKHLLFNTIHLANLRLEKAHAQPVVVPDVTLPEIEEPIPSRANPSSFSHPQDNS